MHCDAFPDVMLDNASHDDFFYRRLKVGQCRKEMSRQRKLMKLYERDRRFAGLQVNHMHSKPDTQCFNVYLNFLEHVDAVIFIDLAPPTFSSTRSSMGRAFLSRLYLIASPALMESTYIHPAISIFKPYGLSNASPKWQTKATSTKYILHLCLSRIQHNQTVFKHIQWSNRQPPPKTSHNRETSRK